MDTGHPNGKESAGLIPSPGRSPGEGNDNTLQYSCLEIPVERGAWQATVHGIAELDVTQQLNSNEMDAISVLDVEC